MAFPFSRKKDAPSAGGDKGDTVADGPGKALPPGSAFGTDDGSADPAFAATIERYAAGTGELVDVVEALRENRVLIPMLAELVAEDITESGLKVDKEAATGVVAVAAPDGRKALPAFTSIQAMATWHRQARPVPTVGARAALAAVAEDWSLLVIDPAGPRTVVIPRTAVWALAQSAPWDPAVRGGMVDESIAATMRAAIMAQAELVSDVGFATIPGDDETVVVQVGLRPGLTRAQYDATMAYVNRALSSLEEVAQRVDAIRISVNANS